MNFLPTLTVRTRPLQEVLHAANMRVALLAVTLASLFLFVLGLFMLRFYMLDNLQLSARTVAYTVEAAVVFGDAEAAAEDLRSIAANRSLAAAYVLDHADQVIAHWEAREEGVWSMGERLLAGIFLDEPALAEIRHAGRRVGSVRLYGAGHDLLRFILVGIACGILALGASIWGASHLSRRDSRQIVRPLRKLAEVTAQARREHRFDAQLEPARISELQRLGEDVAALFSELTVWQEKMRDHAAQLAHQASHDALTGLANRAHFEAQATEVVNLLAGREERVAALFFIDVDCFKTINDTRGHEVGDIVLQTIARRLRARVREDDLLARLGGDEFAALFYPLDDPAQAERIAQSMVDGMAQPIGLPEGATLQVSLSIGVAFLPASPHDTLAGWMKCADQAMYAAKRAGRARFALFAERKENSGG
jgi:diguanylate cyclase (GGDEF)-like protein